jgi:chemotaxis protein MotB
MALEHPAKPSSEPPQPPPLPKQKGAAGPQRSALLPWSLFALTLAALGGVLWLGWQELSAQRQETASARKSGVDLGARLAGLEASEQQLKARVQELESEKGALSTERETLSQTLAQREAELAQLKATADALEEKLAAELKEGEVVLKNEAGRVQVDLVDKVLFASGEAALSPRGEEVLARIGAVLAQAEDRTILVSGHTDNDPPSERLKATYPSNWELSVARAVNVVRFLSEKAQVPATRLVAAGHGEHTPVASNASPKGRARNRRIELLLMPTLEARQAELAAVPAAPAKAPAPAAAAAPAQVVPAKASAPAKKR